LPLTDIRSIGKLSLVVASPLALPDGQRVTLPLVAAAARDQARLVHDRGHAMTDKIFARTCWKRTKDLLWTVAPKPKLSLRNFSACSRPFVGQSPYPLIRRCLCLLQGNSLPVFANRWSSPGDRSPWWPVRSCAADDRLTDLPATRYLR